MNARKHVTLKQNIYCFIDLHHSEVPNWGVATPWCIILTLKWRCKFISSSDVLCK